MNTSPSFAGSIPVLYDDLMVPLIFEPYAVDLAARVRAVPLDDGGVLEIAAGTGAVTRELVRALASSTRIVATDLSSEMLAHAASRVTAPCLSWQQADAQALPFADGTFAAAVCQFGMMFVPDKRAGYAEAARVLAPGGRFVFSVWDRLAKNEVSEVVSDTVKGLFPDDPPRFYERLPFVYWDETRIREDASAAFTRLEFTTVEKTTRAMAARAAAALVKGTPLQGEIEARRPGSLDEITARVEEALVAHFGGREFDNRMSAVVVTAFK